MSFAGDKEDSADFLCQFLQGEYEIIGRYPDSEQFYHGMMKIEYSHNGLKLIRTIDSATTYGTGLLQYATADSVHVLRVLFNNALNQTEITYLIHSDLNNYARLTGYVYRKQNKTTKPGIESAFIKMF